MPPTYLFEDSVAFGVDTFDVTADRRLMEFCLALGPEHYHNGAQDRWLIRRAMQGRLPDSGTAGTAARPPVCRSDYAFAEARRRAGRSHRPAEHATRWPPRCSIWRAWQPLAAQIQAAPATVQHNECNAVLLRGLMVGLFLERF